MAVQRPSRRLHRRRLFFYPLTGTELGSQPSLTTRDRELVSVLEVRIEPEDLNPRPLTPQSVTLPTLPRAGVLWQYIFNPAVIEFRTELSLRCRSLELHADTAN